MTKVDYAFKGSRLVRLPAVIARVGLGRTQLLEAVKRREFPSPVRLTPGGRAVAWIESEIEQWLAARVAARDAAEVA